MVGAAGATLAAAAVFRKVGVPTPVVLVVAGLVLGFLPFVPNVSLNPNVVLLGLLPLLVYQAAFSSSPRAFYRDAMPIGLLAVGLVAITAGVVALLARVVGHLPWPMCFILGTAVGPTDAVAATSIARRLGLPRRLSSLLEGEALFNDGTALVLYASAVAAATTGHFDAGATVGRILYASVVGLAIGLAVGVVGRVVRRWLDDPPIEILVSLLIAYAAYIPAQAAGASGVLGAVAAGLYLGWHSSGAVSAQTRLQSSAFWEILVFLVNAALFILVGTSFHAFTATARLPVARLVATAAAVVGAVLALRMLWMFAMGWVARPIRRLAERRAGWREGLVLGWSGMRGAVTLAAALAIPTAAASGTPLIGRDEVIVVAFAVILVTLVGQGLTLPLLVRRLGITEHPSLMEAERQARAELVRTALRRLREVSEEEEQRDEVVEPLRAHYQARLRRLEMPEDSDPEAGPLDDLALRQELLGVQRSALLDLRRRRKVGFSAMRAIERDLDLEERRLH